MTQVDENYSFLLARLLILIKKGSITAEKIKNGRFIVIFLYLTKKFDL